MPIGHKENIENSGSTFSGVRLICILVIRGQSYLIPYLQFHCTSCIVQSKSEPLFEMSLIQKIDDRAPPPKFLRDLRNMEEW